MAAVPAMQVREQEYQWERQRPDHRGNPRPDYEAAPSALGNSTGNINRNDRSDAQQCEENVAVERNAGAHLQAPMPLCAWHNMELVARRPVVKALLF